MSLLSFPSLAGVTWPVTRAPQWSTIRVAGQTGRTTTVIRQLWPRWKYTLVYEVLRSSSSAEEWQTLAGFYNAVYGGGLAWRFTDPYDDATASAGESFGTGDGSTTAFQLGRSLGESWEPVFLPTVTSILVAGTATTAYTLGSTGKVTFTSAPASGAALVWTGTFDWLCRFDDDSADFDNFAYQFWELKKISFTTVLP